MTDDITKATTAEADSFEAHRQLRAPAPVSGKPDSTPAPVVKPAPAPAAGDKQPSESSTVSETVNDKSTQDSTPEDKKKRDRSEEGRIRDLVGQLKTERETRQRLDREIDELRKGTRKPAEPEPAKPAAAASEGKPKPNLKDFENDPQYKTYADAQEAYQDARDAWRDEQRAIEDRKSGEKRRETEFRSAHEARMAKAREKHANFEETVKTAAATLGDLPNMGMDAAIAEAGPDSFGDLLMHLSTHLDEYREIAALSPQAAYRRVVALELKLSGDAKPPEQPKPAAPISKAPPPATPVGATSSHAAKSTREAASMEEHRRLRRAA